MISKKEKVFKENAGNDFAFILILSIALGFLVSKLAAGMIKEAVSLDSFTLLLIELNIYFLTSIFILAFYYSQKI